MTTTKRTSRTAADRGARRRRRVIGASAGALAMAFGLAPAVDASVLSVGTLTVCQPPSRTYEPGQCARRQDVQVGTVTFGGGGSAFSVVGTGFTGSPDVYSVNFAPDRDDRCHHHNPSAGVTSLLGVDGSGNPNTLSGPSFDIGNGDGPHPVVATPAVPAGLYKVCVQDEPDRTMGNEVVGVVLL